MKIEQLLARRTDLSTFLVHLTRTRKNMSGKTRLKRILKNGEIKAKNAFGHALSALKSAGRETSSQNCVCFTETPLEHVSSLLGKIDGRTCQLEPYGVAITKRQGRKKGVNPIWYLDITPGHNCLTNPLNKLVKAALKNEDRNFEDSPIARITPFIEHMGKGSTATGGSYRKEFWWEREWRHVGDFSLPKRVIVLCPEAEHDEFRSLLSSNPAAKGSLVDPCWGLEQIIAHLAGFEKSDIGPL